jgi:hydrogenase maturation factor
MCLGFEGLLLAVEGEGVARSGTVRFEGRDLEVGLAFVPEARIGDRLLVHSGQAVRVQSSTSMR